MTEAEILDLIDRCGLGAVAEMLEPELFAFARAVRNEAVKRTRPVYFGDGYKAGWNSALDIAADLAGEERMMSRRAAVTAILTLKEQK